MSSINILFRPEELAAANCEDRFQTELREVKDELIDAIVDSTNVNPKNLVVEFFHHTGCIKSMPLIDVIEENLGYEEINEEFLKLWVTPAAQKLRQLVAKRHIDLNAEEMAAHRAGVSL